MQVRVAKAALPCEDNMYECEVCTFQSYYEEEVIAHEQQDHPYCFTCQHIFRSNNELRMHYANSRFHNYCGTCDRHFKLPAELRGHQVTHEKRDIICKVCGRGFPSLSAMAKHVEVGKCYGQHTQPEFVKKIRDLEAKTGNPNLFTVPRLRYDDDNASYGPVQATAKTWNGRAFECYFCTKQCGSLVSLNQHLNSGVHLTSKEFRCKNCGFTATWLSGVIAHIESEKCGYMSRSQVRNLGIPFGQLRIGN